MLWVTTDAAIACGHDGVVENIPRQRWVTVDSSPVLVDDDPESRAIAGCPNFGPTMKPCARTLRVHDGYSARTLRVHDGYSAWIRVDGHAVVLSNLDGLTDGTVPGTVHYTVRNAGQSHVSADR